MNDLGEHELINLRTVVSVDRFVRPEYPRWVRRVLYPEMELLGPTEYGLANVGFYLHQDQELGKRVKGYQLRDHLVGTGRLRYCLGLSDAVEIQKIDIALFQAVFGRRNLFCWRSIIIDNAGCTRIPYLCQENDSLRLNWNLIDQTLSIDDVTAHFPS